MATSGAPLAADGLTKRYGSVIAVDAIGFALRPGRITGFVGPNGAGKTTTIRMLLGLVRPTSGTTHVLGRRYEELDSPGRLIGAALDGAAAHPSHTGLGHLRVLAPLVGADDRRCRELLTMVGLEDAAKRRVRGYSFGMRQRLSLAASLLGDPDVLILDEPTLGLDPDGIRWLWDLLSTLAARGMTILVSSHSLSELQAVVDDVLVIAYGRLRYQGPLADLAGGDRVTVVDSPSPEEIMRLAEAQQWKASRLPEGVEIVGAEPAEVGAVAHRAGIEVHGLRARETTLTDSYFHLTAGDHDEKGAGER